MKSKMQFIWVPKSCIFKYQYWIKRK